MWRDETDTTPLTELMSVWVKLLVFKIEVKWEAGGILHVLIDEMCRSLLRAPRRKQ